MNIIDKFKKCALICAVLTAANLAAFADSDGQNPDLQKSQVLDRAMKKWVGVERWLIEYEGVPLGTNVGLIPVHKIMAVAAPDKFYEMSAHFPPSNPWQEDPFCQELYINQGRIIHLWPFNRQYSQAVIGSGDYIPGTTSMDALFSIVPDWPVTAYKLQPDPESHSTVLLNQALRSTNYLLLKTLETVAGQECFVFEKSGIERVWIASDKGFCLMRHDFRDIISKKLLRRIVVDRIGEVALGMWLPLEFRVQFFKFDKAADKDVIEQENKIKIIHFAINNDVSDSKFTAVFRPGTLEYGKDGTRQISNGGEDLLDDIVNFMVKNARLSPHLPVEHGFICFSGGLLGGIYFGWLLFPKKTSN